MNQRRVIGIVLILFMGVVGYLLLAAILQAPEEGVPIVEEEVVEAEPEPEPEPIVVISVVRSKVPLYRGRVLAEANFSITEMDEKEFEEGMIRSDQYDIATLAGAIALRDRLGNEVLRRDDIFLRSDGNPLYIFLEKGTQVVAVQAGVNSRLNQALQPGDYVDIILRVASPLSEDEIQSSDGGPLQVFTTTLGQAARTIMKRKRIVAIGGRTFYGTTLPNASEEYVLLEVTGKEAEKLVLAENVGTISFILSKNDDDESPSMGTQATELFDIQSVNRVQSPKVYRGGEGGNFSFFE